MWTIEEIIIPQIYPEPRYWLGLRQSISHLGGPGIVILWGSRERIIYIFTM
jgi:hypothetical protein